MGGERFMIKLSTFRFEPATAEMLSELARVSGTSKTGILRQLIFIAYKHLLSGEKEDKQ